MDFMDIAKGAEKAVPKLADVAKDSMDWVKKSKIRSNTHNKNLTEVKNIETILRGAEKDYANGEEFADYNYDDAKNLYAKELKKMKDNLNPPTFIENEVEDELFNIADDYAGWKGSDYNYHNILDTYHNTIAKMNPDEKKLFDQALEIEHNMVQNVGNASDKINVVKNNLMPHLKKLTPAQQETFLKLYPDWNGTTEELAVTARLL